MKIKSHILLSFVMIAAFALLLANTAWAQQATLEPTELQVGSVSTLPVQVRGEPNETVQLTYDFPDGLEPLSYDRKVTLSQDGRALVLITAEVTRSISSGTHSIDITMNGNQQAVEFSVLETRELIVSEQPLEQIGVTGRPFENLIVFQNTGNTPLEISLESTDNFGSTEVDADVFEIGPGQTVEVKTSTLVRDLDNMQTHRLQLFANVLNDETLSRRASFTRRVVPQGSDYVNKHYFPVEFITRGAYQDRGGQTDYYGQFGFSGRGTFTEDSETVVDFEFIVPNISDNVLPLFPMWDRYSLSLHNNLYEIWAGDQNFQQTTLAGGGAYGFGLGGAYYFEDFEVDAFYSSNRRTSRSGVSDRRFGGSIDYVGGENMMTGVNFGYRDNFYSGYTFTSITRYDDDTYFGQLEFSQDEADGRNGASVLAEGRLTYESGFQADAEYGNFSNQSISFNRGQHRGRVGMTVPLGYGISSFSRATVYENRLFSSEYFNATTGLRYSGYSVAYERTAQQTTQRDSKENAIDIRVNENVGPFRLSTQVRLGWVDFDSENELLRNERYRGTISYNPFRSLRLRGGITHRTGVSTFSPINRTSTQYTASANARYLDARFSVQGSMTDFESRGISSRTYSARARYDQRLPWNHNLALEGIWRDSRTGAFSGHGAMLEYRVPINVPLHRSRHTGNVRGLVVNQDDQTIADLPLFLNGKGAVTDKEGEFNIGGIEPGSYMFEVQREHVGAGVAIRDEDREVEIVGGEQTDVVIRVEQTSVVYATVVDKNGEGVSGIVLDLRTESGERHRRITDQNGTARFSGLLTDSYELSVNENLSDVDIIEGHASFDLASGERMDADFEVDTGTEIRYINEEPIRFGDASSSSTTSEGPSDEGNHVRYTVQEGEWLAQIARERYGDASMWRQFRDERGNVITNADRVEVGDVILLPQ